MRSLSLSVTLFQTCTCSLSASFLPNMLMPWCSVRGPHPLNYWSETCKTVSKINPSLESDFTNIFFKRFSFPSCVWVFCLHVRLCITCIPAACRVQKRASYPLYLVLWTAVSCHVGIRNQICLYKRNESSWVLNHSSRLNHFLLPFVCVCVCGYVHRQAGAIGGQGVKISWPGVVGGCETPGVMQGIECKSLEEQQMLLIIEPPFQPPNI